MIWQNPWAWLGLITLALPVLIHLLARRSARVLRFPTLRFLGASRLLPRRRTRLTDLPLLLVRLAIIAAATAALAQPLFISGERQRSLGRSIARAIIVDTSASMRRSTSTGETAVAFARREAQRLAGEAQASVVIESSAPANSLAGAAGWLSVQPGRREIAIVSDFQLGSIDEADLARVPEAVGIQLVPIETAASPPLLEYRAATGIAETVASMSLAENRTDVEWTTGPASPRPGNTLLLLTADSSRGVAEAARRAALTIAAVPADSARAVAIVFPDYAQRAQLLAAASPPNQPWMADVIGALREDSAIASVARAVVDGRDRLLILTDAEPGSLAAAQLIAGVLQALSRKSAASELDPAHLTAPFLEKWQRPAAPADPRVNNDGDASDGRWLWLLVLILLGIETWMRRTPSSVQSIQSEQPVYDRVA